MEIHCQIKKDGLRTEKIDEKLFKELQRECNHFDEGKSRFTTTWKQVDKAMTFIAGCTCDDSAEIDERGFRGKGYSLFSLMWNPLRLMWKHWSKDSLNGSYQLLERVTLEVRLVYFIGCTIC